MERVRRALAQSQRLNDNLASYQQALDQYAIFSVTDASGRILQINDQFLRISGYARSDIIGQSHRILNSGTHSAAFFEGMWQTLEKRGFWRGEICNRGADGNLFWIDACITSLTGDHGKIDRYVAIAYDITERKQVEMRQQWRLRLERSLASVRSEAMLQGAMYSSLPQLLEVLNDVTGTASSVLVEIGNSRDHSTWGLMLGYSRKESLAGEIDAGTLPRVANLEGLNGRLLEAFRQNELFGGLTARQLGATSFTAISLGTSHDPMGALLVAGEFDADAFKEELSLVIGGLAELLALRRDADRRRNNEENNVRMAKRDPLTGLGNRRDLLEEFEARTDHPEAKFALLLVDLDRFKPINDTFGHSVGDTVLRVVSERLQLAVQGDYTVSRMGGDEFAILTEAHASVDEEGALDLAHRIIEELSQPIRCDGHLLTVGASVGIALYPRDGSSFQEVLHCADAAMYRAKANRAGAKVFDSLTDEGMRHRAELETELKVAMDDGSLVPYFQPFVDLATGKVVGHEVLARWNHPVRGSVPPVEFVKIAEDAGMVEKLFWLMLRTACKKHVDGGFNTILSLNLVPAQIENPAFVKQLIEELEAVGFPPHLLEVEITETTSMGDLDRARPMLMLLKTCGIQIALDDFGVGYSSLALLRNLPISKLKIDRSFTSDLESDDPGRATLVNAILGIASAMYLKVTAEGIEHPEVADYLRNHGAHYGQGYLYGRPSTEIVLEVDAPPPAVPVRRRA
jgi:diguanylate cyclase (GGDEF)-like protein/PAS domain S-box-containing protein